jgi:hypothetical protein
MMMSPSKIMGPTRNFVEIQDQPVIDGLDRRLTMNAGPAPGRCVHDQADSLGGIRCSGARRFGGDVANRSVGDGECGINRPARRLRFQSNGYSGSARQPIRRADVGCDDLRSSLHDGIARKLRATDAIIEPDAAVASTNVVAVTNEGR